MYKKLSKKEGKELVTKEFLYNDFREELNKDIARHIGVMMEKMDDKFDVVFEKLDETNDRLEMKIEIAELRLDRLEDKVFA